MKENPTLGEVLRNKEALYRVADIIFNSKDKYVHYQSFTLDKLSMFLPKIFTAKVKEQIREAIKDL